MASGRDQVTRRRRRRRAGPRVGLRRGVLLGAWLLAGFVILGRAAQVQVLQGGEWRQMALEQHRASAPIAAARGSIVDRNGVPLAVSRESWIVSVAPHEIDDVQSAQALLAEALGVSASTARRLTDPSDPWRQAPGRYGAEVREIFSGVTGIYLDRELERSYPHGDVARSLLGHVVDGEGAGGIEQAYDRLLRGTPGRQVVAKDSDGRRIPGEVFEVESPVTGGEVRLTIDLDLQEIAEEALAEAVETAEARGGDIVVSDPRTGEILAMASMGDGSKDVLSAVTTSYEPGSTLKPFTVAALLKTGRGSLADSVDTGMGYWRVGGHPLRDVSAHGVITLAEALRVSSNIGIAKAAQALTPAQQFENLRDFGFGVATGIELPGEAQGRLPHPDRWSARSPTSLAIGYEIAVTPLQMTAAYGALANGGSLLQPRLVREARGPDGGVEERGEPSVIRRVIPESVSLTISRALVDVVEGGTGTAARIATFQVAGKSGTSYMYDPSRGAYVSGRYFASFIGFFPAEDPQLVVYVKLNDAQRYGGAAAAPVTRATMEAVLAARQAPIDRRALLRMARSNVSPAPARPEVRFASVTLAASDDGWVPPPPVTTGGVVRVAVPDVAGLPARVAVRRLHALGFRVAWEGEGHASGTSPPKGARLAPGDTVWIRSRGADR
jgi:cell division protein FtsI (penicillin-binding protein 3)